MRALIKWMFIVFYCMAIGFAHAAQPTTPIKSETNTSTITLQDLISQNGIVMNGIGAARELYLPLMAQWDVDNIVLHIIVTYADMMDKNGSVTAYINNFPISAVELQNSPSIAKTWDITIPKSYITGPLLTVIFKRNSQNQGVRCDNIGDASTWVAFANTSTISYSYKYRNFEPNLSLFPSPFINKYSIYRDNVAIAVADDFDNDELEAAYYAANSLHSRKTWRGLDLTGTMLSNLSEQDKKKNIVIIGVAKKIRSVLNQLNLPLHLNNDEMIVDENNKPVDSNTGVILEVQSPWSRQNAVLIVTGNSGEAVRKAANSLRDKAFSNLVLFNKYVYIKSLIRTRDEKINWHDVDLSELGYTNDVVYGSGGNSVKYSINFPANKLPTGMNVDLHYSASPILSGIDKSFITAKVNGLPVNAHTLSDNDDRDKHWKFHVDSLNLLPGKNEIVFDFNLKFLNRYCSRDDLSLAWGIIYSDSNLEVSFQKANLELSFGDFNVINQDISVFIPKQEPILSRTDLLDLVLGMARNISNINKFEIYDNDKDIGQISKSSNIIYIGSMDSSQKVYQIKSHFPFCYIGNKVIIKQSIAPYFHSGDENPVAMIELIKSPFSQDHLMLVMTANNFNSYKLAIKTLFTPERNQYLRGNVALIYNDGTFTSVDTNKLETKSENAKRIRQMHDRVNTGAMIVLIVFFGGIFLLIIYRRAKRYFSRNVDR